MRSARPAHARVISFEKLAEKGAHIDKAESIVSGGMGVAKKNYDKKAPIFGFSGIGVVGDATKILPALTEEIKKRKASQ